MREMTHDKLRHAKNKGKRFNALLLLPILKKTSCNMHKQAQCPLFDQVAFIFRAKWET